MTFLNNPTDVYRSGDIHLIGWRVVFLVGVVFIVVLSICLLGYFYASIT